MPPASAPSAQPAAAPPGAGGPALPEPQRGLTRARTLWRLFRHEQHDPAPFYRYLASELVRDLERRHGPLAGLVVGDLGCGPGWYTEALRARGASVVPLDAEAAELHGVGAAPAGSVVGDAAHLPLRDGALDAVVCSNMLEHVPDAGVVLDEVVRVLRPGGWAWISWTNWWSPWGGHEMSPYHYLGPRLGPWLYERRHGPPRKNRYGTTLFACHIGPTLRLARRRPGLRVERVEPRYWPWARAVMAVPLARELLSWNCVIHASRVAAAAPPGAAG